MSCSGQLKIVVFTCTRSAELLQCIGFCSVMRQCSHTILCDTTRILDHSTTLSTQSENFTILLWLEYFNSAFAPSYLWKSTYITFCKHRIIKNPCTSAIVAQVGVLYSIIWRAPRNISVPKVWERWAYEVWKVGHLFSTARKPSGWEATMEKSSHLRGATMQWCSAEREVGRLHSYAQLLDCPFPLWRHKDWTSYKSKPTKSSLPRALSSTNHEVSPSSDHHHGIECPDKSPMNDIHWGVTIVHDSSQLNACLTLNSKVRLPSQGVTSNHSNWARCALEVKAAELKTCWMVTCPFGSPIVECRLQSASSVHLVLRMLGAEWWLDQLGPFGGACPHSATSFPAFHLSPSQSTSMSHIQANLQCHPMTLPNCQSMSVNVIITILSLVGPV